MRLLRFLGIAGAFLPILAAGTVPAEARSGLEGVPSFAHVFVLILENEDESATWGTTSPAQYLNSLRSQGVFLPNYYATGHASLDNYIAMVSGQPDQPLTGSDCMSVNLFTCVQGQSAMAGGRNLGDQLDSVHATWKGYMDSMPSACFHADYSMTAGTDPYQGDSTAAPAGNYADRHNPFIYFADVIGDDARCKQHEVPYTQLAKDIASRSVPRFAFITPDTCHDGHDPTCAGGGAGGLVSADLWLSQQVPAILRYVNSHNGLLLITSDESGVDQASLSNPGCCSGGAGGVAPGIGGQVGLLALAPSLQAATVQTKYDHMSLLRTLEDSFGISEHLNNAAMAQPMADLFKAGARTTSEDGTAGREHAEVPTRPALAKAAVPPPPAPGRLLSARAAASSPAPSSAAVPAGILAVLVLGLLGLVRRSRASR